MNIDRTHNRQKISDHGLIPPVPSLKSISPVVTLATLNDTDTICTLGKSTFYNAYKDILPIDDLQQYIDEAFSPNRIREELMHPDTICLLANDQKGIQGYAKFFPSPLPASIQDLSSIELQRLYTAVGFEGNGIGKALMVKGEQLLLEHAYQCIWLKVWEGNINARNIYLHWGFHTIGQDVYKVGNSERHIVLMKKFISS